VNVTLYTRKGCHLCDVMKDQLDMIQKENPFELSVFDIDLDPQLRALYNEEVPVLMVEGKKIAKYRLDAEMLVRRLREKEAP
jgi:glutaredoxin